MLSLQHINDLQDRLRRITHSREKSWEVLLAGLQVHLFQNSLIRYFEVLKDQGDANKKNRATTCSVSSQPSVEEAFIPANGKSVLMAAAFLPETHREHRQSLMYCSSGSSAD